MASLRQLRKIIRELEESKSRFGNKHLNRKLELLKRLDRIAITNPGILMQFHDILCFMRAYPDNPGVLQSVKDGLKAFARRIDYYNAATRDRNTSKFLDTGITGTSLTHEFSYELAKSLAKWYPEYTEIDWERYDEKSDDPISAMLSILVAWQENDTLDNDLEITTRQWLDYARSGDHKSILAAYLKLLQTSGIPRNVASSLYDNAEIPVKWELANCPASRTNKRIRIGKIFYQQEGFVGRSQDLRIVLQSPTTPLKRLAVAEGEIYIRHIKEILGVRCRELYPLINAEPREVYTSNPGRGVQIAIYGDKIDVRLPLEANFGAMLVRNDMPIGYGVGCMLFDRVEIAINIFPSFRGGESAFIIEHFFQLFYHHFKARLFLVRSYQVGDDNDEALSSGAFWFYYKLGFRPVDNKIRKLAGKEYEKIKRDKSYRTPSRTLKRLAKSDVFFHSNPDRMAGFDELPLKNLGYIVTRYIADKHDGNRQKAIEKSIEYLSRMIPLRGWQKWPADEITALRRMAPLLACIPDLKKWSAQDKSGLVDIIRARGKPRQRQYALLCIRHHRFRKAIEALAFNFKRPDFD